MPTYHVHVLIEQYYEVNADNPVEAAALLDHGYGHSPVTTGSAIEKVTGPGHDYHWDDDLRPKLRCDEHKREYPAGQECSDCLTASMKAFIKA